MCLLVLPIFFACLHMVLLGIFTVVALDVLRSYYRAKVRMIAFWFAFVVPQRPSVYRCVPGSSGSVACDVDQLRSCVQDARVPKFPPSVSDVFDCLLCGLASKGVRCKETCQRVFLQSRSVAREPWNHLRRNTKQWTRGVSW